MNLKWNDKIRLYMINKSEYYYGSEKIYQFGFYDGYNKALEDSKYSEMLQELIKEVDILKSMGLGDTERCKRKEELIRKATEL